MTKSWANSLVTLSSHREVSFPTLIPLFYPQNQGRARKSLRFACFCLPICQLGAYVALSIGGCLDIVVWVVFVLVLLALNYILLNIQSVLSLWLGDAGEIEAEVVAKSIDSFTMTELNLVPSQHPIRDSNFLQPRFMDAIFWLLRQSSADCQRHLADTIFLIYPSFMGLPARPYNRLSPELE